MNRTLILFLAAWIISGVAIFATQTSKKFYLSEDKTSIQERITDQLSSPLLMIDDLLDSVPDFYPHVVGQKMINEHFHLISVSPNDASIAFVAGEGDQWLGTIDTKDRTYKFILFGIQTRFIDALWTPDGRYLAYAFVGPDRRMVLHMIEPPAADENKPHPMNGWQYNITKREGLRFTGWNLGKDTSFSFQLIDAEGKALEKITLPLHRQLPVNSPTAPTKSSGQ